MKIIRTILIVILVMINVLLLNCGDSQIQETAKALRKSKHKSIRLWIERAFVNQYPYKNWRDKHVIDDRVGNLPNMYFEWNIDSLSVQHLSYGLRCLMWRKKEEHLDFCILTNDPRTKNRVVMFEDSRTDDNFPNCFLSIRCFGNYKGLMNYCKQIKEVTFSLHDSCYFKHEHSIPNVKGAEVYREIATGRLWYEDTLHRDHYEVYDCRGKKHIAEANMDGTLDFNKADSAKQPIV